MDGKTFKATLDGYKGRIEQDATSEKSVVVQTRAIAELVRDTTRNFTQLKTSRWNWSAGRRMRHPSLNLVKQVATITETTATPFKDGDGDHVVTFSGLERDVLSAIYLMDLYHEHIEFRWDEFRDGPDHKPKRHGDRTGIREAKLKEIAKELGGVLHEIAGEMALRNIRDPEQAARVLRKRKALAARVRA